MGTHPIFESDFDCLTEMEDLIFDLVYEKVKDLPTKSQTKLLEGVQKDLFSLPPREQVDLLPACPYFASKEYRPPSRLVPLSLEGKQKSPQTYKTYGQVLLPLIVTFGYTFYVVPYVGRRMFKNTDSYPGFIMNGLCNENFFSYSVDDEMQKIFFENHAEDLQFRMEMLFGNKNEICFMQDIEAMSEPTSSFLSRTHNLSS